MERVLPFLTQIIALAIAVIGLITATKNKSGTDKLNRQSNLLRADNNLGYLHQGDINIDMSQKYIHVDNRKIIKINHGQASHQNTSEEALITIGILIVFFILVAVLLVEYMWIIQSVSTMFYVVMMLLFLTNRKPPSSIKYYPLFACAPFLINFLFFVMRWFPDMEIEIANEAFKVAAESFRSTLTLESFFSIFHPEKLVGAVYTFCFGISHLWIISTCLLLLVPLPFDIWHKLRQSFSKSWYRLLILLPITPIFIYLVYLVTGQLS